MTSSSASPVRSYHDVDISSPAFWARTFNEREDAFAALRQADGPTWHPPLAANYPHQEAGFWACTRHEDITYVSTHHEVFSSAEGVGAGPMPKEAQAVASFFLMM